METATSCEIVRLPEDLLAEIISLTSPLDAFRAAAVSQSFRAAADSDAVWSRFLPHDLPPFDDATELALVTTAASKKARFVRLSDHPILLSCKLMSVWLDRTTGGKCYTLSARALNIWGQCPQYWRWIHVDDVPQDIKTGTSILLEAAQLIVIYSLEIRAKIQRKMLSQNSTYAAYIVFKLLDDRAIGLSYPFQEACVRTGRSQSTRRACLDGHIDDGDRGVVPRKHAMVYFRDDIREVPIEDDVVLPRRRADGWMELELGGFFNDKDDDGDVCFAITETNRQNRKSGLVVRSIEVRIKQYA